jgi:hypothetical protein
MENLETIDNNFNNGDQEHMSSNGDEEEVEDGDFDEELSISDDDRTMTSHLGDKGELRDGDMEVPDGIDAVGFELDTERANDGILISRHLFEANGKLFMVKREKIQPVISCGYNRKVEVFEADVEARMWIPVTGGVPGALFVSRSSSKYVPAFREGVYGLTCHFVDEHDMVVNQNSQPYNPCEREPMWLFTQKLVV